LRDLV